LGRFALFFFKKNQVTCRLICLDSGHLAEKSRLKFFTKKTIFQLIFLPRTIIKHRENYDKSIYSLKKPLQNINQSKLGNQPELIYVFS